MKFLSRFQEETYALLRIMSGFMFCFHGVQKMFGLFGGSIPPFGTQLWFAGFIELTCGAAIFFGWHTRLAAFLASGEMAVAYFQVHWRFQMGDNFFPGVNRGEMAVLYCFLFLYFATRGDGKWSLRGRD